MGLDGTQWHLHVLKY